MLIRKTSSASSSFQSDRARACAKAALDKQAIEPVLLDLTQSGSYTDYLLIASAQAERGVTAIAEHVIETMQAQGAKLLGVEGLREGRWALIDFGDIVVHVFLDSLREFYDLEGLWFDAPRVPLPEAPARRPEAWM